METNSLVSQLLDFIARDKDNGVDSYTIKYANEFVEKTKQIPGIKLNSNDIASLKTIRTINNPNYVLLWLSVMAKNISCDELCKELLEYTLSVRETFSIETQFFLFSQINAILFGKSYSIPENMESQWNQWLFELVSYYRNELSGLLSPIGACDRNKNLVFVVSNQIIGINHAPTSAALEWCKCLLKQGKNVLLINTAECLSRVGEIPFMTSAASYINEYSDIPSLEYDGFEIPFYQCPQSMPDKEVLNVLLQIVREERPEFIISMGDIVFSDLADKIIPVYSVGLSSDMPRRYTKYRSLYRSLTDGEVHWMKQAGFAEQSLIRTVFSFKLPNMSGDCSRKDFDIPDDSFCFAVAGNRLDEELNDEFFGFLQEVLQSDNCFVCFIGGFDYEAALRKCPVLDHRSTWIPYAKDLLAVMNLIDLYVNPKRMGGGTSALYAMSQGKPVLAVEYGDVALNAGSEFCVKDYSEMIGIINRYVGDRSYYDEMSVIAQKRVAELTNTEDNMLRQIKEIEIREQIDL